MSNSIKVFLRVRPTKRPSGFIDIVNPENNRVDFNVPSDVASTHVNNTKTNYKFKFDGILEDNATQEQVFQQVAEDAIQGALEGYNSTIFAYGQTGSGKTFTITGGAERYIDRGIIPRTLSKLFSVCEQSKDVSYTVYISYLEIYNDCGYDLLSAEHENAKGFENLPKVSMREDELGNIHLKNLSMHLATQEEDALNLLFLGDTNRAIAETPMNMASSRSHCIFTVSIEARSSGSETIKHSKLHIVDLAGSERVHKTHSSGQVLREAKFINSSLHFLEMVIVALHEKKQKGRQHIPYRNSLMTSILRDSLGGNSRTSMIATISAEASNTEESISTCRFAQRVALVENNAIINEEIDPSLMIQKLKGEVRGLQEEVSFLKGENPDEQLSDDEKVRVQKLVEVWALAAKDTTRLEPGPLSFERIHVCFQHLKDMVLRYNSQAPSQLALENGSGSAQSTTEQLEELERLATQVRQRDHEIAILVNMVKQAQQPSTHENSKQAGNQHPESSQEGKVESSTPVIPKFDSEDEAFEWFSKQHKGAPALNENKEILRNMYEEAKTAAGRVNQARDVIKELKNSIEGVRNQRVVSELMEDSGADIETENKLLAEIESQKVVYKSEYHKLKGLKTQIEQVKRMLKAGRVKLQLDFDMWYDVMRREGAFQAIEVAGEYGVNQQQNKSSMNVNEIKQQNKSSIKVNEIKQLGRVDSRVEQPTFSQAEEKEGMIPSTGNEEADADIRAFFKAKELLLRKRRMSQQNLK